MPAITYSDFSGGLDRRLPIGVQEANKLYTLRNAYITNGKRIRKRPALQLEASGLAGSRGLRYLDGALTVFASKSGTFTPPTGVEVVELDDPTGVGTVDLRAIPYAEMFSGYPYVVATYTITGVGTDPIYTQHHYVDASLDTRVTDVNCPQGLIGDGPSATKAASRVFATGRSGSPIGTVRYCAAGDPRDWTTSNDAGFLSSGLQQDVSSGERAVGTFQDALVVFYEEGAQIWDVAVDPSANAIRKRLYGFGTNWPASLSSFVNDLAFLSQFGFRSMRAAEQTDRIDDWDIGVSIDPLVIVDLETINAAVGYASERVFGNWVPQLGQYWVVFNMGSYSKAWVYTHSKSSKISCWSEYTFDVLFTDMTTGNGRVYLRTNGELYSLSESVYTDEGSPIAVEVQMAFQDAKQPGVAKQWYGADYVVEGSPTVAFKFDPRNLDRESVALTIPGDTRPGDVMPVEIVSSAIAPVFRHEADEAFELDAVSLYYNPLSNFAYG